ncbi:hypothetical protein WJ33_19255 [Burkholderia ubonensis]|uniref:Glycosyl hydrolase n=1 Tax=Burkholderia ubonensis TaxID=101571 RepID=A0A103RQE1_9BURK|nr:hypothetical protein [Burkholderia ubonensis]KVG72062.1 hypothetical protein WJ33_19255 [Burkholderia ubonensis]
MIKTLVACAALCAAAEAFAPFHGSVANRTAKPAHARTAPTDATRAGARIAAVDENGVVLVSDDDGKTWRQAPRVPVSATLPAVAVGDARFGLAGLFNH